MDSAGVSWSGLECVSERAWGYHDGVPQGMCDMKFVLTRSTAEGVGGFCSLGLMSMLCFQTCHSHVVFVAA